MFIKQVTYVNKKKKVGHFLAQGQTMHGLNHRWKKVSKSEYIHVRAFSIYHDGIWTAIVEHAQIIRKNTVS